MNTDEEILRQVYNDYLADYEEIGFIGMVKLFSEDDFYKLHREAKRYLAV